MSKFKALFGGAPEPKIPELPPVEEAPSEESIAGAAADDANKKNAKRRGRASTILSGNTQESAVGTTVLTGR